MTSCDDDDTAAAAGPITPHPNVLNRLPDA